MIAAKESAQSVLAFVLILLASMLAGCSGLRVVDSQVASFSTLQELRDPLVWEWERLPSQQVAAEAEAKQQANWEAIAAKALAKVNGVVQADPERRATHRVQMNVRVQRLDSDPLDSALDRYGFGLPGRDYVVTGAGQVIYMPVFPRVSRPWFSREVGFVIREAKDGRVVYETSARHEGPWGDDSAVLPAMFEAVLKDFPRPPEGRRVVKIGIP